MRLAPVLLLVKQGSFDRLNFKGWNSDEMFLGWVLYGIPIALCHKKVRVEGKSFSLLTYSKQIAVYKFKVENKNLIP